MSASTSTLHDWIARRVAGARCDRGAQLIEYGLLLALIAAVCVVAVSVLGGSVSVSYSSVAGRF